jgi:hypothetical protein
MYKKHTKIRDLRLLQRTSSLTLTNKTRYALQHTFGGAPLLWMKSIAHHLLGGA